MYFSIKKKKKKRSKQKNYYQNSGGGNVELFSDHIVQLYGENTNILGENRITFESLYDVSIDAETSFESRSNLLDFNTLGDIRITSTTANVKFVAGSELILEGEVMNFEADVGVDVSSLHGDIFVNSGRNVLITSADTVDFEIVDDANFISQNGPVSFKAADFDGGARALVHIDASSLTTESTNFNVDTVVTTIDTHGSIQFTFTGNGAQDSLFNAEEDLQITANYINSQSNTLLINTDNNDPQAAGDIIFQTNSIDESTFISQSVGDTSFTAGSEDSQIILLSGSIDNSGDTIFMRADLDLNINAEYKTFDFINVRSDQISLSGSNEKIAGNIGIVESSANAVFTHPTSLNVNAGPKDGTVLFESSGEIDFNADTSALFHSRFDSRWTSYSSQSTLSNFFDTKVFDDVSVFSHITNFVSGNDIEATSHFINFVSDDVTVRSTAGDITFSSDNFDFWANEAASMTASGEMSFNFIDDLTFKSFADLTIDNLVSLFATSFLGFESNEAIEVFAQNIKGGASTIDLISNARSPISWIGTTFNSTANGTFFEAPHSLYSSIGDLTLSGDNIDIESILEYPISFTSKQSLDISMDDGSNFMNSDHDLNFVEDYSMYLNSEGSTSFTAFDGIYITGYTFEGHANNMIFTSDSDVTFNNTYGLYVDTTGDMNWNVNRDSHIEGSDFYINTVNSNYNVKEFNINSNAPEYFRDGQIGFYAGDDMSITMSGSFSQNGGSVSYSIGSSDAIAAADTYSVNSIDSSTINVVNGNLTFDGTPQDSSIRFQSMDFVVNAALTIDFLGGDITLTSNRTQDIIFDSAHNITINTHNDKAFTWTSRDDINSTVGNFTVWANRKDSEGNSISFKTTDEEGNYIVNVRSGWLNFQSRDSQTYSANFIELFAANDLTFNTSLALSPNTGGITFTTDGFSHDPVSGERAGITFTSTGIQGYIYLEAPLGKETYFAGYDLTINGVEGDIDILANDQIKFTSNDANILISSADHLTFVTDAGDITFQTNEGNTEFRASSNINLSAATNIYLTSNRPITKSNGRAFEFAASSGAINVFADSDSNINWIAGGDIYTQSAETTTQFGDLGIFYTAQTGHYLAASKTGIKLVVENGDMNFNASDSINFSSGNNWDIFVSSGQSSFWEAQSKNIAFSAAENTTIRTERNNVLFQTEEGNIFIDSTGQIRFQADGTNSNPGGSNVDGVFVIAPNIDVNAKDKAIIESEAYVTIGANTNPVVKFEAGGSAASIGVEMTAVGNVHFTIQEDVNINSGGNLFMEAAKQFDLQTVGSISITSTGTDATGKDFIVRTFSQLDVNAQEAFINGHDAVNIISFDLISFQVTGSDPVTSNIEVSAQLDFTVEVDGKQDINGNNWTTVAEERFDIVVLGDLLFENDITLQKGDIYIYGDHSLDFVADSFLNVVSTGDNSNITFTTFGTNSDISIFTYQPTSNINFHSLTNFASTSVNDLDFQTIEDLTFTSFDNIDDDVEKGHINFLSPDDIQAVSNTLTLQGNKGASFTTVNKADITLQSAGSLTIQSYEQMLFESANGKMSITATEELIFSTYAGREGDITISTTRDLLLTSDDQLNFNFGDDLTTIAQTINFDSNNGYLSVITEGAEADLTFDADVIILNGGEDSQLFGSDLHFSSTGTGLLHADFDILISTIGNHAHITYSSNDLLSISAPQQINFYAKSGSGRSNDQFDYFDYYNHNGHGFINFTASGINPEFGYGVLLNSTNGMDIYSIGSVIFTAPTATLQLTAASGITLSASTSIRDKKAIRISSLGTDSKAYFNASQEIYFTSNDRNTFYADSSIEFYPYNTLQFTANRNAVVDTRVGIEVLSTHPYADIHMFTTDFLTGEVAYSAFGLEVYGERGLQFHLQDDDDSDAVGTYQIQSEYISIEAHNRGYIQSIAGGDIVITAPVVHIHAGDDLYVDVTQQFNLDVTNAWNVVTVTPVSFLAPGDYLSQTSTAATTYNVGGDSVIIAQSTSDILATSGGITYLSGVSNNNVAVAPQTTSLLSTSGSTFSALGAQINTQRMRSVDFVDGLIIPVRDVPIQSLNTACTIPREFFFDTTLLQFCYCNSQFNVWNCAQTMRVAFPY